MDSSTALTLPGLELHLFGRFRIYIKGQILQETDVKGRKARSLLKLIAHQRHYQMVRDQVIDILWPELDAEAANSQLYKALHHIRKAFADYSEDAVNWIEISENVIRLTPPGGLVTDVQRFEKAANSGLRDQQMNELENAVSLYTDDFLPEERYADWASIPREHYRQLYLDVLSGLALEYEKKGNLSDAAEMLRLALDKEPTLENAHRGLMRIFANKGQSTRAFHQYDKCREILGEELGISPSPETRKTLDDIREGRLHKHRKTRSEHISVSEPASPVIGRSEECAIIGQLLENLESGSGDGLVVCGEAGIGKSRMVKELIRMARQRGLPFFLGGTELDTGKMAYGSFVELFEDILHKQPEAENIIPAELGRFVPGYNGEGYQVPPHADKLAAKYNLFARVHRFFAELAAEKPVIIILEDLHQSDKGTRELLIYLNQHRRHLPILFVSTVRKEDGEQAANFLSNLQSLSAKIIELTPLTYDEHIHLIHQNSQQEIISTERTDHFYQLAEGNPFIALELLRNYTEYQKKGSPNEQYNGKPAQPVSENIPASIHNMVEQKLEKLSPPARHLLYIAAVIGKKVPYELLASIWSVGVTNRKEGFYDALEEVIRARLLEEKGLDYSFRHALVQETIYASISAARRQILHKQIAGKIIELSAGTGKKPVGQISRHYLGAGEMAEASVYLLQAGEEAESAYAHEDALQYYQEAYEILEGLKNNQGDTLKYEILERTGDVYRACGKLEKSYDAYEEAITIAEKISENVPELMELYRKMAVVAIFRTEMDRSEQYLEKAFKLAGDDPRSTSRLYITKALHLWHLNQLEEAYKVAHKALSNARKADSNTEASQACEVLAMICLPLGRWEEGLKHEMERHVHGWSPEIVVATDAHLCLWEYHVTGDQPLEKARSFIEQVAEQASHTGDLRCVAVCHYALGTMYLWRGNRQNSVEELNVSLKLHEQVGSPAGMAYSLARKSVLHTLMGAKELGWQAVKEGLGHASHASVRDHCLQRLYGVGIWNRLEAGDLNQASTLIKRSEELLKESGACAACALELYPWLAYYFLHTSQFEKAKECGQAVFELAEKTGNPIGKAISAMIESSLCVLKKDHLNAERYSTQSYQILKKAVPETTYSPVAYYLNRMVEQQANLV